MQHNTSSTIARTMRAKMPSVVVTFLLSAILLVLCKYGNGLQLAIIYNSEVLKYCVDLSFIFFLASLSFGFAISYLFLVF
jgi:hypothetical protein